MATVEYWDIEVTRQLVDAMFGINQSMKARESMISCQERLTFADIHLTHATSGWAAHLHSLQSLESQHKPGANAEMDKSLNRNLLDIGANIHGCVQSLHALRDILAHAIYYSLGINHTDPPKSERDVTARHVLKSLRADASLVKLADPFEDVCQGGDFLYLDALNNHGKHRSLVPVRALTRLGSSRDDTFSLELLEFDYGEKKYDKRPAIPFLRREYLRMFKALMKCGTTMDGILRVKTGRHSPVMIRTVIDIDDE